MIVCFGSINVDLVSRVAAIPRPGETVLASGYAMLHGGKGGNQSVAAARASRGTDLRVLMAGRVGQDEFGRAARQNLVAEGVDAGSVRTGPEPTGCAFISVDARGENAITVASGANGAATAEDLARPFEPDDLLVLQMEVPWRESLAVARWARRAGARVVWNLAPVPSDFAGADLRSLLAQTDVVVLNEHEAQAAASLLGGSGSRDARSAARILAEAGGTAVALTLGVDGAVACLPDGTTFRAAALPVVAADTTGAGDTFVGVLAVGLAEGAGLAEALPRACLAASLACTAPGAQPGMPDRNAISAQVARG